MKIPTVDVSPRDEKVSQPISIGSLIPEAIDTIKNVMDNQSIFESKENHQVIEITDSNRSDVEILIKSQKFTIVHCWYKTDLPASINLSNTTFLWDEGHNFRSRLVYSDGMPIAPKELGLCCMESVSFTLYFEPLPPECTIFWLWEETCEPYAFASFDIKRNEDDVYWTVIEEAPF